MAQRITVIDAFTEKVFAGNPAAVCVLETPRDDTWMQNLAREMNLSETAFLVERSDGWSLRWFTPLAEVELCGHATLASAHQLWESGRLSPESTARFHTLSGILTAKKHGDWIEMDFPATPAAPAVAPEVLIQALGLTPKSVGKTKYDFLAELESEAEVRALAPDFQLLKKLSQRGCIVTAPASESEEKYDFVSRYFAPAYGIDEDPVTGSSHCALGPYWAHRLDRGDLVGFQASARGGMVRIRIDGERVALSGRAVTVLQGELVGA